MGRRLDLHEIFATLLGSRNVYFQPPATLKMQYPCILYNRGKIDSKSANNNLYNSTVGYSVTLITSDPDSATLEKILQLPLCRFDRHFTAENLNHDVFTLYY